MMHHIFSLRELSISPCDFFETRLHTLFPIELWKESEPVVQIDSFVRSKNGEKWVRELWNVIRIMRTRNKDWAPPNFRPIGFFGLNLEPRMLQLPIFWSGFLLLKERCPRPKEQAVYFEKKEIAKKRTQEAWTASYRKQFNFLFTLLTKKVKRKNFTWSTVLFLQVLFCHS